MEFKYMVIGDQFYGNEKEFHAHHTEGIGEQE